VKCFKKLENLKQIFYEIWCCDVMLQLFKISISLSHLITEFLIIIVLSTKIVGYGTILRVGKWKK